eukprot:5452091-Amphidinium_carterae.1
MSVLLSFCSGELLGRWRWYNYWFRSKRNYENSLGQQGFAIRRRFGNRKRTSKSRIKALASVNNDWGDNSTYTWISFDQHSDLHFLSRTFRQDFKSPEDDPCLWYHP